MGITKHVKDCFFHLITPCNYKDVIVGAEVDGIELLGASAIVSVRF